LSRFGKKNCIYIIRYQKKGENKIITSS